MIKAFFQSEARQDHCQNGWTFGHIAQWLLIAGFFMLVDLIGAAKFEQAALAGIFLFLSFFRLSQAVLAFLWGAVFAVYIVTAFSFHVSLLTWPVLLLYPLMLLLWGHSKPHRFSWNMNFFETYRALLALVTFSWLGLLAPWDSLFCVFALLWSVCLLVNAFLWQVKFPNFFSFIEPCIVASSLGMFYSLFSCSDFSTSSALFFMMTMSSWNLLVWPARRQEKASLEYLKWPSSSELGWGWALFLRLEQWKSSPIYFTSLTQNQMSDEAKNAYVLLDENHKQQKGPEAIWYLMRSCGGIWSLWGRLFEKLPMKCQKAVVWLLEARLHIDQNQIDDDLREAIKERERR